jgi:4-amino-4-deoxy-L-arabinose transferase-like glycosyltransferase
LSPTPSASRRSLVVDLLLLTLLIGGVYLLLLGHRPLAVPSEARYAEIPREMVATGDWLTPRLNGVKYFEKPPLFYWLVAAAEAALGRSELVVRLWTAAFGLGGCLVVYVTAACLWRRRTGWLAAVPMASALLYFELSRQTLLDMPVTFFLTVTFAAFLFAVRAPRDSPARTRALYLMYAAAAAATMTKGLIGIVLPGMVVFVWLLITGRWSELKHVRLVSGTLLFLALAAPWHIMVGLENPEFFWFYFVHEHLLRFLTPEAGRSQPAWFFVPILLAGWLPWVVFLPSALIEATREWWEDRAKRSGALFILLWFLLPFLFFSASHSKLISYALPFFPPLALLLGLWLDRRLEEWPQALSTGLRAVAGLILCLAVAAGWFLYAPGTFIAARHLDEALPVLPYLPGLIVGLVAGAIVIGWLTSRRAIRTALAATAVGAAALGLAVDVIVGDVQPRSIKPLAAALAAKLQPGDEVAALFAYYQDLPFYLDRRVTVAATGGDELDFGRSVEDVSGWMIGEDEFWRRWGEPGHRMYAVLPLARLRGMAPDQERRLVEIARTRSDILVTNQPM